MLALGILVCLGGFVLVALPKWLAQRNGTGCSRYIQVSALREVARGVGEQADWLGRELPDTYWEEGFRPYGRLIPKPMDTWGRAFGYLKYEDGKTIQVTTLGSDGLEGGTDKDADICYVYDVETGAGDAFQLVPCTCGECYKWVDFEY